MHRIEEAMKERIVKILYNLIGKGMKPDGKSNGNGLDSGILHVSDQVSPATAGQDTSAAQLVDRKTFEGIVGESLKKRKTGWLLVCDVDRCREINDIYGRDIGDNVLRYVACVLCDVFGKCACIGSPGSDTFVLWLHGIPRDNEDDLRMQIGVVNDRLLHSAKELPPVTLSVGAAYSKEDDDCRSLVKRAGKALYIVKESGRCGCEVLTY